MSDETMTKHTPSPGTREYIPGQLCTFPRLSPLTPAMSMLVLATTQNGGRSTVTRLVRVAGVMGGTLLRVESLATDVRIWDEITSSRAG